MKIILDECMPRKIGDLLNGHIVKNSRKDAMVEFEKW